MGSRPPSTRLNSAGFSGVAAAGVVISKSRPRGSTSKDAGSEKRLVRDVLEKFHSHLCIGAAPDLEQLTIEHVVPEAATTTCSATADDVASIGNLILLDEKLNNDVGDKPFKDKTPILQAAQRVWIDPLVLEASSWKHKAIQNRAEEMARIGYSTISSQVGPLQASSQ